jgi:hypothetical protein
VCQNGGCSQTKISGNKGVVLMIEVLKEIIEVSAVTFFSVLLASIVVTGIAAIITDRFFR